MKANAVRVNSVMASTIANAKTELFFFCIGLEVDIKRYENYF